MQEELSIKVATLVHDTKSEHMQCMVEEHMQPQSSDSNEYVMDHETYRADINYNSRVKFLIYHYTATDFLSSIKILAEGVKSHPVSVHYLIPDPSDKSYQEECKKKGFSGMRIFNLVDEKDRAWHAGISSWGDRNNINDTSLGVEIVYEPKTNQKGEVINFHDFNPQQISAAMQIGTSILRRYPDITSTKVLGHSDIAYTRKSDPGPSFPWKKLYDHGIGAWYDDAAGNRFTRFNKYLDKFETSPPAESEVARKFVQYGYRAPTNGDESELKQMVDKFNMHFRGEDYGKLVKSEPDLLSDILDPKTCAIIYTLCDKYRDEISAASVVQSTSSFIAPSASSEAIVMGMDETTGKNQMCCPALQRFCPLR